MASEAQSGSAFKPAPVLADDEIARAFAAKRCLACGGFKAPLSAFCLTDHLALTIWARNVLARGPEDPGFAEMFRSALEHLRLNPHRKRYFSWPHRTPDDLATAGYEQIEHGWCRAPGCGAEIVWFWVPGRLHRIAINLDCSPHRDTCANPEYFQHRVAQRPAPKRRARR